MYAGKNKRKMSSDEVGDRFYRKIHNDSSEQIPVIGNCRPQTTLNRKLDDEELGSLMNFKVQRHCRNSSATSRGGEEDSTMGVFQITEIPVTPKKQSAKVQVSFLASPPNIHNNVFSPKKSPIALVSSKDELHSKVNLEIASESLTEDENSLAKEILNPHKRLQEKRSSRFRSSKTVTLSVRKDTDLEKSTQVRSAF